MTTPTTDFALVGYMRSGKDSVAACMCTLFPGLTRVAFADALKEEVCAALSTVSNTGTDVLPSDLDANKALYRPLLQWWGAEYRRGQDPNYWVRQIEKAIQLRSVGRFVCTDARFVNELTMLREQGFKLIELRMDQQEIYDHLRAQGQTQEGIMAQLNHISEREWRDVPKDISLESHFGNLSRLTAEVVAYVTGERATPEVERKIAEVYAEMYPTRYKKPEVQTA